VGGNMEKSEQQQPTPSPPKKRHPAVYVVIGIIIGALCISAVYFVFVYMPYVESLPKPEIIRLDGYGGFEGFNYVFYVDVTVKNNGGEGYVSVFAEIRATGKYEKQEQILYMYKGQSQNVRFTFDITLWGSLVGQVTYKAWAVPK
jgi:hypothetical protein